mmetsp:Transcript_31158/g.73579  ORF Transcript_31158/g.73579 Transcript_31158/m.73579 type:complete len:365 (+) Transcript_31158:368-1462(+)
MPGRRPVHPDEEDCGAAVAGVGGGDRHRLDGHVGRRARVRPRRLLRQPSAAGRGWVRAPLDPARAVLLVAALARGAPREHEPHHQGRDARARRRQRPRRHRERGRRGRARERKEVRQGAVGSAPAGAAPWHRLAGVPALGRHGRAQVRHLQPLRAIQALRHGALARVVAQEGHALRHRHRGHVCRARRVGGQGGRRHRGAALRPAALLHQHVAGRVHLAAAHRRRRAPPDQRRVLLHARRFPHRRPAVRPYLRLAAPQNRLDARGAPHRLHHPALPRARGDQRHQGGLPQGLPLRPHARAQGHVARGQQLHRGQAPPRRPLHLGARRRVRPVPPGPPRRPPEANTPPPSPLAVAPLRSARACVR